MSISMSGHLMRVVYRKVLEVFGWETVFLFSIIQSIGLCCFFFYWMVIKLLKNINVDLLLIFYDRWKIIKMVAKLLNFYWNVKVCVMIFTRWGHNDEIIASKYE